MRKMLWIAGAVSLALAGSAQAVIGWAGNAYPNHGANIAPTGDQFVVAQVWKGGVTDQPGQGPDIAATLYFTVDGGAQSSAAMAYNTDIGNNDEYIGFIPQADLVGGAYVDVTVVFTDLTDQTTFEITGDQNGNPPPLRYTILAVLPNDVAVTFTLCMSGEPFDGAPCVIGSADVIGNWTSGVLLNQVDGDLWDVTVVFPAGANPAFEYKYKKNDCNDWEGVGNRAVVLPTDGTTSVALAPDSWNNLPIGCGLGNVLEHQVEVCFQVCLQGVDTSGGVCVTGNLPELTNWGNGLAMYQLGPDLYQACLYFQPGQPIPLAIEYKYRKDGCETWESVGNRMVTVDGATPAELTVTHTWDDGPGVCDPVAVEPHSWSAVKELYR